MSLEDYLSTLFEKMTADENFTHFEWIWSTVESCTDLKKILLVLAMSPKGVSDY